MTTIAIITLLSGILIFAISLPLIYRKIPMNRIYGIRTPAAFKSERDWYEINEYGGRRMAIGSWFIIGSGIAGFLVSPAQRDTYFFVNLAVILLAVILPVFQIFRWKRTNGSGGKD